MKFFDKEKDLIHRIVNLIFIIWVIVTLVIFYDGSVNLILKEKLQSYSEYKEENCNVQGCSNENDEKCIVDTDLETYCKSQYYSYKNDREEMNNIYTKQIISSLASGITVAFTLYLLNKKKVK